MRWFSRVLPVLIAFCTVNLTGQSLVKTADVGVADAFVNISASSSLCVNTYVHDSQQELLACCSTLINPGSTYSVSVRNDLLARSLIVNTPQFPIVTLVPSAGPVCDAASVAQGNLTGGLSAKISPARGIGGAPFQQLAQVDIDNLSLFCSYIKILGSGVRGICNPFTPFVSQSSGFVFANSTTSVASGGTGISATFGQVTNPGSEPTLTVTPYTPAGNPPLGFTFSGLAFDITTNAAFVPPVTVCFTAPSLTPAEFAKARVLHFLNGAWVDETILSGPKAPDPATQTLCANVTSLSPFAIAFFDPLANDGVYHLRYFNTSYGSGVIVVSNAGTASAGNNPADDSSGTICANFYSFDPNEEMQTCCACPVTPNGLSAVDVNESIIPQNLITNPSSAVTVKVLFTLKSGQNNGGFCDPTKATAANLARGGLAWGTNLRSVLFQGTPPVRVNAATETRFSQAELSNAELAKLTTYCTYIKILGSSVSGICKGCLPGARGAIGK